MKVPLLLLAVAATGCTTAPPLTVSVEIPVACVAAEKRPVRPGFVTESELAALNDYQAAVALEAHRLQALGYIGELEAIVEGCSRIPAAR